MFKKSLFILVVILVSLTFFQEIAFCVDENENSMNDLLNTPNSFFIHRLPGVSDTDNNTLEKNFIPAIINFITGAVGVISLIVMLYAGIMMVTSAGDEEKRENAKKALYWGVTGIVFVFLAYIIVKGITSLQFNN